LILIIDKIQQPVFYIYPEHKGAWAFVKRCKVKGKTVKVRHMPAVAVIGDKDCSKATLYKKGKAQLPG